MIKMKYIILALISLILVQVNAQELNKTDSKGRKQGKWIKYYEGTTKKRYVGQFVDDKPFGKFTYYYNSGEPSAVSVFSNNGTITHTKTYHKNGSLMATGKYVNQQKDSVWWYFTEHKEVLSKENYVNGKLEGEVIVYYPGDPSKEKLKIYEVSHYKNGIKSGLWQQFHKSGKLKAKGYYKDGYYNGKVFWYYGNGKVELESFYKHTVPHGYWYYFDDQGNMLRKVYYLNGKILEGKELEKYLEQKELEKEQSKG